MDPVYAALLAAAKRWLDENPAAAARLSQSRSTTGNEFLYMAEGAIYQALDEVHR